MTANVISGLVIFRGNETEIGMLIINWEHGIRVNSRWFCRNTIVLPCYLLLDCTMLFCKETSLFSCPRYSVIWMHWPFQMKNDFPPNTLSHSSLVVCTEKIFLGKIQGNPTLEDTCLKQCYYNTIQTTNFIPDYGYLRIMISLGWISKGRKICAAV